MADYHSKVISKMYLHIAKTTWWKRVSLSLCLIIRCTIWHLLVIVNLHTWRGQRCHTIYLFLHLIHHCCFPSPKWKLFSTQIHSKEMNKLSKWTAMCCRFQLNKIFFWDYSNDCLSGHIFTIRSKFIWNHFRARKMPHLQ